jgi:hypothetical protein
MGRSCVPMAGFSFGEWTVLYRAGSDTRGRATWVCRCSCGVERVVRGTDLRLGDSTRCKKCKDKNIRKHGMSDEPVYFSWRNMMARCYNNNTPKFYLWGGKGIVVCSEWHDVAVFSEWALSNGYQNGLSLDRIDSSKNYEPGNCEWVTVEENSRRASERGYNDDQSTSWQHTEDILGGVDDDLPF